MRLSAPMPHKGSFEIPIMASDQPASPSWKHTERATPAGDAPAWREGAAASSSPWMPARRVTLVIVVSAHGGADKDGAFLLPTNADARPLPLHRLRLASVLDRLERMPRSVKKVLILDVTQLPAHWPLGMLHNDFVRGIEALEP